MKPDLGKLGIFTTACEDVSFARAQEIGAEIESLGFGAVWLPETVGDALLSSSVLLGATSRIAVATGISSIWTRDAAAMAGGQRRLEQAFPGRFLLGLGVSHELIVEAVRGQSDFSRPFAKMSRYLDDMDDSRNAVALMEQVATDGLTAVVGFEPGELPPRLPRVVAALGPRMLALSAEKADGPLLYFQTPEHTAKVRAELGPDAFIAVVQMAVDDDEPGLAAARRMLDLYSFLPSFVAHFERQGFTAEDIDNASDRLVDGVFVRGDAERTAGRLRAHLDAGADHVAVQVVLPTWPYEAPSRYWAELADTSGDLV